MPTRPSRIWLPAGFALLALAGIVMAALRTPSKPIRHIFARESTIAGKPEAAKKFKILHIMSYHSPWEWTDDQLRGFQDGLGDLPVEFKIFQMDGKRRSSPGWKERAGLEARRLIETWHPDLVYTNDDIAQEYVTNHYIDRGPPFVFSAVNAAPDFYHFADSRNITGVLEREHAVETIRLLQQIVPAVKRIAIIVDDDPTWDGVVERLWRDAPSRLRDIELAGVDKIRTFDEYQRKVMAYQTKVDALGLLGIHTFKGADGKNVPWQDVLRWTATHSRLPDFSFWKDRVTCGTLCAVYVSGYEQGLAAGRIARSILVERVDPAVIPIEPTTKGRPAISLARAKSLGLRIKSGLLLAAEVETEYAWEHLE